MNIYLIHSLCRRVLHDKEFRNLILASPEAALQTMPFTEEERDALLSGDVGRLNRLGASGFLLLILARFEVFGLALPIFNRRMRTGKPE
ncbi:aromatic ring-opening dioxygenase LigA [Ensifer sp. Root31]|uniref:aromatic ring-opening dioxygenase LigA n=1 Tax=Ensifer sp. Root31 TaxID=1736512 RepID=UPI00070B646F|nr:aromatic ring-opening dioxygenase LigA [Ensifer sp. Root31]KQU89525.1 aromatic ring-opening dioxygenase LigA [Ensifer sp. Root31]